MEKIRQYWELKYMGPKKLVMPSQKASETKLKFVHQQLERFYESQKRVEEEARASNLKSGGAACPGSIHILIDEERAFL
ncbi:hypothetical protein BNJ_00140 [Kaumoebavirus]|uniref:hypothetical protein n=1 Tax=Kaumoebavirus TaxID=1859492 RepID=UPI0009C23E4F|nr:hypothetical protein BNJ_00140 [Kaumoebavirus]ARA71972.1 hypothetical protein BNJ_00140 [Kaumoebavirus]